MANCVSTIRLETGVFVPCGKCYECIRTRYNSWAFRLKKEYDRSLSAVFLTLTYEDGKVPLSKNGELTLRKSDLQKFFKRLRKLNKEKLKYYAVGEYGGITKRPHYHAILFNADVETIAKAWALDDEKIGEIHVGDVTEASIGYTLKYIQSGKFKPEYELDDRDPHFAVMSKRLGDNYLTENMKKWHLADLKNRYYAPGKDGKKVPLSRYYKDKLFTPLDKQIVQNHLLRENLKPINLEDVQKNALIAIEKHKKFYRNPKNSKI